MADESPAMADECKADVGVVGIGVMGGPLALNLLDKGFKVGIWDLSNEVTQSFAAAHGPTYGAARILAAKNMEEFVAALRKPRKALILVPAGSPTESVIETLMAAMEADDIIVDTGNSHFKDQSKRAEMVEAAGKRFLGMGISGGAEGARKGPAFFPGGTLSVWEDVRPIVEAAAAKAADGRPCVTMCGRGGAGSCVKMYHNAGEYAVLQIWGEAVSALRGLGLDSASVQGVLADWRARGVLDSYMLDITHEVVGCHDNDAGVPLLDRTADMIGSKGTGLWSVQVALDCGVPVPSLAAAVLARQMSMARSERVESARRIASVVQVKPQQEPGQTEHIEDLYWAVLLSILASYAQMFQALRAVDREFGLDICGNLPRIISTFRAGCVLQGALLEPMTKAFECEPELPNLLCAFEQELAAGMPRFRAACARLVLGGEAAGVIQASLTYVTSMTQSLLGAAQVVALQRDVFGRHGFKRIGEDGEVSTETFKWQWREMIP